MSDRASAEKQIISRKRVVEHGEVYTGKREVNAMLDLVKQETETIGSRFLEPACGTGNFLTAVLERKLAVVEKCYGKSQLDFEINAVWAVSSLYGIDKLRDNVSLCRERLFGIFDEAYERLFPTTSKAGCREAVRFIIARNIVWGDALKFEAYGPQSRPIIFPEWQFVQDSLLKRRDFSFRGLLEHEEVRESLLFPEPEKEGPEQGALFTDLSEEDFSPKVIQEYDPVDFMEIAYVQQ